MSRSKAASFSSIGSGHLSEHGRLVTVGDEGPGSAASEHVERDRFHGGPESYGGSLGQVNGKVTARTPDSHPLPASVPLVRHVRMNPNGVQCQPVG